MGGQLSDASISGNSSTNSVAYINAAAVKKLIVGELRLIAPTPDAPCLSTFGEKMRD